MRKHVIQKWTMVRVLMATHDLLHATAEWLGKPMARVVDEAVEQFVLVTHVRRIAMPQAMPFFLLYVDDKPMYMVVAKDKTAAEQGYRQTFLGTPFKKLNAVLATEADIDDLTRTALLAILTQINQINQLFSAAAAQAMQGPTLLKS